MQHIQLRRDGTRECIPSLYALARYRTAGAQAPPHPRLPSGGCGIPAGESRPPAAARATAAAQPPACQHAHHHESCQQGAMPPCSAVVKPRVVEQASGIGAVLPDKGTAVVLRPQARHVRAGHVLLDTNVLQGSDRQTRVVSNTANSSGAGRRRPAAGEAPGALPLPAPPCSHSLSP